MVNRFCSKCGKNIKSGDFFLNFMCENCYFSNKEKIEFEEEYKLAICRNCNAMKIIFPQERNWIMPEYENMTESITYSFYKSELFDFSKKHNFDINIKFDKETYENSNQSHSYLEIFLYKGEKLLKTQKIHLKIKLGMCSSCSNTLGKRYIGIIQIRNHPSKEINLENLITEIREYVNELRYKNPELYLSDIIKVKNGYDLKVGSLQLMKQIKNYCANKYKISYIYSKSLIGKDMETGGGLYRTTLLIRIFPFNVGEIIIINKNKYKVMKLMKKNVQLKNVATNKIMIKNYSFLNSKSTNSDE